LTRRSAVNDIYLLLKSVDTADICIYIYIYIYIYDKEHSFLARVLRKARRDSFCLLKTFRQSPPPTSANLPFPPLTHFATHRGIFPSFKTFRLRRRYVSSPIHTRPRHSIPPSPSHFRPRDYRSSPYVHLIFILAWDSTELEEVQRSALMSIKRRTSRHAPFHECALF
jgi:hypothetical protein